MKITFDNVQERVVNNRSISRKEKQNAIREFLRANSGEKKPTSENEIAILENLKALRKAFALKDSEEKARTKVEY